MPADFTGKLNLYEKWLSSAFWKTTEHSHLSDQILTDPAVTLRD